MDTAVWTLITYVVLAVVTFLIVTLIARAIFRINKIVDLLSSIDSRLGQLLSSPKAFPTEPVDSRRPAPHEKNPSTPASFGIAAIDISVGDKLEKPGGQFVEVVEFVQGGLKVKDTTGSMEILTPRFQKTQWLYDVRRPE